MPNISLRVSHCADCNAAARGTIFCHRCRTVQPLSEFYRDRRGRDCYHAGCKTCRRESSRVTHAAIGTR